MQTLVSIIIPTYNRSSLLREALSSVINQTYANIEILVVDDGSTDDTVEILSSISDSRLRIILSDHVGRSRARNIGLREAKGEFITFLDSDDLYLSHKVETQVKFLEQCKMFGAVYSSADVFLNSNSSDIVMRYEACNSGDIYKFISLFFPNPICLPTVMIRKEIVETIGEFDATLDRFEDTDYWRRISKHYSFGAVSEALCLIRTHEENSIQSLSKTQLAFQVRKYIDKVIKEDLSFAGPWIYSAAATLSQSYGQAIMREKNGKVAGLRLLSFSVRLKCKFKIYLFQNRFSNLFQRHTRGEVK